MCFNIFLSSGEFEPWTGYWEQPLGNKHFRKYYYFESYLEFNSLLKLF